MECVCVCLWFLMHWVCECVEWCVCDGVCVCLQTEGLAGAALVLFFSSCLKIKSLRLCCRFIKGVNIVELDISMSETNFKQ